MTKQTIIQGVGIQEVLREELQAALQKQSIEATEMAEYYLVNLLSDFHRTHPMLTEEDAALFNKPLALLFMEASQGDAQTRMNRLKRLGDSALVISGFFAERIKRTLVNLPYYISMGGSAYSCLADLHENEAMFHDLYSEMADKFEGFAQALSILAPWNKAVSNIDLLNIYERWLETGDENLKDVLDEVGIAAVKTQ